MHGQVELVVAVVDELQEVGFDAAHIQAREALKHRDAVLDVHDEIAFFQVAEGGLEATFTHRGRAACAAAEDVVFGDHHNAAGADVGQLGAAAGV